MFSENLKYLRKEKNLTKADLGKILDDNTSTISLYESGKVLPNEETLNKISTYFNIPIKYLLAESSNPSKNIDNTDVILSDTERGLAQLSGGLKLKMDALCKFSDKMQEFKSKNSNLSSNESIEEFIKLSDEYRKDYVVASTMNFNIDGKYTNLTHEEVQLLIDNLECMGFDILKMINKFKERKDKNYI